MGFAEQGERDDPGVDPLEGPIVKGMPENLRDHGQAKQGKPRCVEYPLAC